MTDEKIPTEYKDKFQLFFVQQSWTDQNMIDPRLKDWVAGRVDIRTYEDQYANNMEHFCTPNSAEWIAFSKTYSGKWINQAELNQFIKTLKEKFYQLDENHNPIL